MPLRFQSAHPNIIIMNITKNKAMEVMDNKNNKVMEVTVIKNKATEVTNNKNKVMVVMNIKVINKRATDTHTRLHHHTLTHPADHLMNLMDIITKPNDATQFVGFMIALHAYILPNIDSRRSKLIHMTL